jgi:hypothetical protein
MFTGDSRARSQHATPQRGGRPRLLRAISEEAAELHPPPRLGVGPCGARASALRRGRGRRIREQRLEPRRIDPRGRARRRGGVGTAHTHLRGRGGAPRSGEAQQRRGELLGPRPQPKPQP